jgi:hypothetical protein
MEKDFNGEILTLQGLVGVERVLPSKLPLYLIVITPDVVFFFLLE